MTANKYYEILGIENDASKADIRKAYYKLALKHHPDKNGDSEESKKKMQEIGEAYEKLTNEHQKGYATDYYYANEVSSEALVKRTLDWNILNSSWVALNVFYTGEYNWRTGKHAPAGQIVVNDYDLENVKKILKIMDVISESNKEGRQFESGGEKHKSARYAYIENLKGLDGTSQISPWFSRTDSWEGNINRTKTMLNYFRDKIGLRELTDQDFRSIEGNPNETPQIPNEEPDKIEDGVVNVDEYNKLWYGKGKDEKATHPDIVKYWKLRDEIIGTTEKVEKHSSANPTLYDEVNDKTHEAEKGEFRRIWNSDDKNKVAEIKRLNESKLAKMKETFGLMEKLIAEGKKEKNPGSEVPNIPDNQDNQNDKVNNALEGSNKRKAEVDIREQNNKKSRTIGERLDTLIHEANGINDYQALEAKIKEIDRERGELEYKNRQNDISQLKIKLGNLDRDKFRKLAVEKIEAVIKDNKIDDSDPEIKSELAKLKNENDVNKINQLSIEISEKVGKKGALNTLQDWLKKAKDLVEGVTTGTKKYLEDELKKVQKGLQGFKLSTNSYQQ
ncbi:MAG: DnaJ domain-containing protein, partial [Candidatus Moeniiplasma glomeromycotorum]|nr:DnaJ domain-containing protein [Candidatus Moeniiplasma glomeromycotorum]